MSNPASQMDLFGPSVDIVPRLKAAMVHGLAESRLSREQVVERMNRLLAEAGVNVAITKASLDKWVSLSSPGHLIPLRLLPAFCQVVETTAPLAVLAAPLGAVIAGPREQRLMELGRAQLLAKQARKTRQRALLELEDMP